MALDNTLPELREKEQKLRARLRDKYGIAYVINEGEPNFAGLRTADTTAKLLRWRDQVMNAARQAAESRRRAQGGNAAQIKAAGDAAAQGAYYRVSPYTEGFHGVGGAFDIRITDVGKSAEVERARLAGEQRRRDQAKAVGQVASPVQVQEAGRAAALVAAYEIAGREGEGQGLRWGGRFSAPRDVFHFELPYQRAQVAARFAQLQKDLAARKSGSNATTALVLLALGGGLWWYAAHGGGFRSLS